MNLDLLHGVSCLLEERRFKRKKAECPYCNQLTKVFTVPALRSRNIRKAVFCIECKGILIKPKRFCEDAMGGVIVMIQFESGKIEESHQDYPIDPWEVPFKLTHVCYDGQETNLVRYREIVKKNHGDYLTLEQYFECPKCLQEKLLKHQKKS